MTGSVLWRRMLLSASPNHEGGSQAELERATATSARRRLNRAKSAGRHVRCLIRGAAQALGSNVLARGTYCADWPAGNRASANPQPTIRKNQPAFGTVNNDVAEAT